MKSRPPIEKLSIYGLLALFALMIADFSILNIRPRMLPAQPPPARHIQQSFTPMTDRSVYNIVTSHNIFNADQKIADPFGAAEGAKAPADAPPVPTQLPLQLLGTIVHVNPMRSVATISVKSKSDQMAFRVTQTIPENLATVEKIERNKVIFRNKANQRLEFIEIKEDTKFNFGQAAAPVATKHGEVLQTSDTDFSIKNADIKKFTNDLPSVLQSARAVQVPGGFRIEEIMPNSIFEKLGLKPGDTIRGVNGEAVDNPAKAMELYNQLRTANSIKLDIERGGQRQTNNYSITQ